MELANAHRGKGLPEHRFQYEQPILRPVLIPVESGENVRSIKGGRVFIKQKQMMRLRKAIRRWLEVRTLLDVCLSVTY